MTVTTFINHQQLTEHVRELIERGTLHTFNRATLEGYTRTGERHVFRTYVGPKDAHRLLGLKPNTLDDSRAPVDDDTRGWLLRAAG